MTREADRKPMELCADKYLRWSERLRYSCQAYATIVETACKSNPSKHFCLQEHQREYIRKKCEKGNSPMRILLATALHDVIEKHCPRTVKVLDIGCGEGGYSEAFASHGCEGMYLGIDLNTKRLAQSTTSKSSAELRRFFVAMKAEDLDTLKVRFTFALSLTSLEHVEHPLSVLKGIHSALEPGSCSLHVVPAPWSWLSHGWHGWRRFSSRRCQELFTTAGFHKVKVISLGGFFSFALVVLWGSLLERMVLPDQLTFGLLPRPLMAALRMLRLPEKIRAHPRWRRLYARLMERALYLDRWIPLCHQGYAVLAWR